MIKIKLEIHSCVTHNKRRQAGTIAHGNNIDRRCAIAATRIVIFGVLDYMNGSVGTQKRKLF